jgi:hypothetical protein
MELAHRRIPPVKLCISPSVYRQKLVGPGHLGALAGMTILVPGGDPLSQSGNILNLMPFTLSGLLDRTKKELRHKNLYRMADSLDRYHT